MRKKVPMSYDAETDRWTVELDGDSCGLHCGEGFEILIDGNPIPCRIEMDREWYVIMKGTSFYLRKGNTYLVNIR